MAVGTTTAILLGLAGAGASKILSGGSGSKGGFDAPQPLPQPPSPADSSSKAAEIAKRKRSDSSQTVYSSPLGIGGTADVNKKVLLGQ